ncbi:hypothetical protein GMES_0092 [Paraglaciecola mesophila KMM 241]|uniref:DUF3703 domain-containing protein n=1 Tax=Paraglaciecola mesophila KMM 241 TaxID=1128912 RepID=K6YW63_9ALTE|nr:DUF3703 domain-containing protein [Paraglaciecola mesophila]GAC22402.1 hypothetical protein GMES_0092 [Paraglaciecola mesophila KMM 241]
MKTNFRKNIRFVVLKELAKALKARHKGDYSQEFIHLEHAHVLGQNSTYWHTKIHCLMFAWARRQADKKEYIGQVLRIAGAVSKTAMGAVPQGTQGVAISALLSHFHYGKVTQEQSRVLRHLVNYAAPLIMTLLLAMRFL